MTELNAIKRKVERISPQEWLRRREANPQSVQGSRFVAPKLGAKSFGYFEVVRDNPYYEVELDLIRE
jgi:hypothetical protein